MKRMYRCASLVEIQLLVVPVKFVDDSKCVREIAKEIGSLTNGQIGDLALKEVLSSNANGIQSSDYKVEITGCTDSINFKVFKREIDYYFE